MSGRNLQRFYGHPRNDNFSLSHSFKCTNTMADGPTQPPSWKMFQGHMPRYLHQYRTTQNVRQFKDSKFHSKYINIQKNHLNSCSSKNTRFTVLHISTPFLGTPSPPVLLPRREGVLPGRHATEIHALEAGALQLNRVAIVAGPGMSWMAKQQFV